MQNFALAFAKKFSSSHKQQLGFVQWLMMKTCKEISINPNLTETGTELDTTNFGKPNCWAVRNRRKKSCRRPKTSWLMNACTLQKSIRLSTLVLTCSTVQQNSVPLPTQNSHNNPTFFIGTQQKLPAPLLQQMFQIQVNWQMQDMKVPTFTGGCQTMYKHAHFHLQPQSLDS